MSIFFGVENLTKQSVCQVIPWEFSPTQLPSDAVCKNKSERQLFYRNAATAWQFYSMAEGANPNQRVSKNNAPRRLHGIVADFDVPLPDSRIIEAIASFKIKPSWFERSLGGNVRLIWLFTNPLLVDSYDFATYLLDKSRAWLHLDTLPGLDSPALTDPSRMFCNGGKGWTNTGFPPITEPEAQSFFVEAGKDFRFNSTDECAIPLDIVEHALRDRFPDMAWPNEFIVESAGPSFWIAGSTSPMSAIVKPDGMFSFSAHATKPFYSWGDILGTEFVSQFAQKSISHATDDIWWDGKSFWKKEGGRYVDVAKDELLLFFKVDCRLSAKPNKGGISPMDTALRHVQSANRIVGAAPFVFHPPGVFEFQNNRVLNTSMITVLPPADGNPTWGAEGEFPWLSAHFDNFFDPPEQLPWFLAWWKAFYESGYFFKPMPGQNIFLMGGANVGKTMTSHAIIAKSVGGFMDAARHLTTNSDFNSELPEKPLWTVDDETMGESGRSHSNFAATWKKAAANQNIRCHKKFGIPVMITWMGRIIATSNLDAVSSRILGPMDNSSLDKTSLFRCAAKSKTEFPNRHELIQIIARELPYFLRWLLNWTPPDYILRDVRYGYQSYHEPSLLDTAHQSGKAAPFKELLIEALENEFGLHPEMTEWRGSVTQILRLIQSNGLNEAVIRTLRLEQTSRYLENLQRDGILRCRVEMGSLKTRIWVFPRFNSAPPAPVIEMPPPSNTINIFTK